MTLDETLSRIASILRAAEARLSGMDLDTEELAEVINVNANDGSNQPAGPPRKRETRYVVAYETASGFRGEYRPRRDYSEAAQVAAAEVMSINGNKAVVVAVTREIVAEFERCGHA